MHLTQIFSQLLLPRHVTVLVEFLAKIAEENSVSGQHCNAIYHKPFLQEWTIKKSPED